jgi:hypothetical protein
MCTLIVGRGIPGPDTILVAANRDERPERASEGPGVLCENPRVVGGRDVEAGGTWLAIRDGRAVVALLNRRVADGTAPAANRRSRGLLTIDVASTPIDYPLTMDPARERRELVERIRSVGGPGLGGAALCRAFAALWEASYGPFSLVWVSPESAWLLALDAGGEPRCQPIPNGWHVITHAELDDESEPRTARLLYDLAFFRPLSVEKALQRLGDLMRSHGAERGIADPRPVPAVCLHDGVMRTVSSTMVAIGPGPGRYLHTDGRPCENRYADHSHLLEVPSVDRAKPDTGSTPSTSARYPPPLRTAGRIHEARRAGGGGDRCEPGPGTRDRRGVDRRGCGGRVRGAGFAGARRRGRVPARARRHRAGVRRRRDPRRTDEKPRSTARSPPSVVWIS